MSAYSIQQINNIIKGELYGNSTHTIEYLIIDSRNATFPAKSLFFAITGVRHNGHNYINDLYLKGVRNFVVEKTLGIDYPDASVIVVPDTLAALQMLAGWHRQQFKKPVVAITGSNGKTILKEWIYQVTRNDLYVVRSPKSYNSQVGVPLSLWQMEPQHNIAIIEAGISLPGEMEKLEKMIMPDIGIFTNLGEPHQENFTDLRHKCSEKLKLFKRCKTLIYSRETPYIEELFKTNDYKDINTFCWSRNSFADLNITNIITEKNQTGIHYQIDGQEFSVTIPFIDHASIENAINLIAFLIVFKYNKEIIRERLKHLSPIAMRLELKAGINNCTLINDSYNSDLGSLTIALDYMNNQNQHSVKTVILSDILQSGKNNDQLYNEVSNLVRQKSVNKFIGIGQNLLSQKNKFPAGSSFYESTQDFLNQFTKDKFLNETILLKGSRFFEFEKILKLLEEKVHQTVLEINLNSMVDNLNYFRSRLKPGTRLIAMVKAFSYGSGSFEIANLLQYHRVDYLAVAFADEGVGLRESGITIPIIVMNPEKNSFNQIIQYHLEPELFSFNVFSQFLKAVEDAGYNKFPVHIKLDTGMNRLGFTGAEIDKLTSTLSTQKILEVKSVFSHLAASEDPENDDFTNQQIDLFDKWSGKICKSLPYKIWRHILNSAGIERFPESQYDMVRLGIGLYGISSVNQSLVKQVSTLKTVILQIKDIQPGETVGYNRKFKAQKAARIGIIPIGYADGLHRKAGNGNGKIWIKGKLVPIIGNICMDMSMIDISDVSAEEGDEVIIFGEDYPITEIAKQMDTIPYEVLTGISQRVKRIYYHE